MLQVQRQPVLNHQARVHQALSPRVNKNEYETIEGTGNSADVPLTMTLFGVEYTVGESKVKDLVDNGWGYDSESWKDIDMDKEIEYKDGMKQNKTLDNNTTEVSIQYKNLADTFAVPEDCIVSFMAFAGSINGSISKAEVKIMDENLELSSITTVEDFDEALKAEFSSFKKRAGYYGDNTYDYKCNIDDVGEYWFTLHTSDGSEITKFFVYEKLSDDYTMKKAD